MGRRARASLIALIVLGSLPVAAPANASPESDFVSRINAERRARSIAAVAVSSELTAVARRHSQRMASQGRIYHNANLRSEVRGWQVIGENVGRGSSVREIHDLFMRSAPHRSEIIEPRFRLVGVGVAWAGKRLYVTQVFVDRLSGGSTTTQQRTVKRSQAQPAVAATTVSTPRPQQPRARPQPRARARGAHGRDAAPDGEARRRYQGLARAPRDPRAERGAGSEQPDRRER